MLFRNRIIYQFILLISLHLFIGSLEASQHKGQKFFYQDLCDETEFTPHQVDLMLIETREPTPWIRKFDVVGYDRVYRKNTPFGTFKVLDLKPSKTSRKFKHLKEYTMDITYIFRIGGFQRGDLFSPDEVGRMLATHNLLYTDGPGNDIYESLMICKKYDLNHTFVAPDFEHIISTGKPGEEPSPVFAWPSQAQEGSFVPKSKLELPYLEAKIPEYKHRFSSELDYYIDRLSELSELFDEYGGLWDSNYKSNSKTLWLLFTGGDLHPFQFFLAKAKVKLKEIKEEFKAKHGFDLPLMIKPETPLEKARRIKFWHWIRKKYTNLMKLRADIFRDKVAGEGIIVSNIHLSTEVDYELFGEAFDHPGVAIRPQMSDRPLDWEYIVGYGTRLIADLTDKLPIVSPRANLPAAGARVVPTKNTQYKWYNQAIQNGCAGFYIWNQDFQSYPGAYSGACVGNPDSSSLPYVRWYTPLEISKELSMTKIFIPLEAETGILISLDACALGNTGWKKVFSSYIDLKKACVWNGFITDQEVLEGTEDLSKFKTLYIPVMDFEHREVAKKILKYVKEGGTVISGDPEILSYDLEGESLKDLREEIFGVIDIKPRNSMFNQIKLKDNFKGITIEPYSYKSFNINTQEKVKVIGEYTDGSPAVVLKQQGNGKAFFFGAPLFDIYFFGNSESFREDTIRYHFYKQIENESGIQDESWIWDVNIGNLHQLTDKVEKKPQKVIEGIKFRYYFR